MNRVQKRAQRFLSPSFLVKKTEPTNILNKKNSSSLNGNYMDTCCNWKSIVLLIPLHCYRGWLFSKLFLSLRCSINLVWKVSKSSKIVFTSEFMAQIKSKSTNYKHKLLNQNKPQPFFWRRRRLKERTFDNEWFTVVAAKFT